MSLADDGFLLNPESKYAKYHKCDAQTFESMADVHCLVLLGERGIGKSKTLENEFNKLKASLEPCAVDSAWINLRDFSSEERLERAILQPPEVVKWQHAGTLLYLFLDSFDEGLLRVDNISRVLVSALSALPVERLRLRIASRPHEWPASLESSFEGRWGEKNVRVFQLAPLRKIEVRMAARREGIDDDAFIDEVVSRNVVSLASKPITLDFLIGTFKKNGSLPKKRTELYLEGCKMLCEESQERQDSPGTRGHLAASQRMAIAARIAAVMQISNRSALWLGQAAGLPEEDLPIDQLAGGEIGDPGQEFEVNDLGLRETIGSGLFSSWGLYRQGWAPDLLRVSCCIPPCNTGVRGEASS